MSNEPEDVGATPEDPLGLEARYPNQQRATEPDRLAQDGESEPKCACPEIWPGQGHPSDCPRVLAGLEVSGSPAASPGPRFGERVLRAFCLGGDGIRSIADSLAAEIDADAAGLRAVLAGCLKKWEAEKQDLRQRIEAAVERSGFFPESGARSVIYADILLAAIAEIFGERLAESQPVRCTCPWTALPGTPETHLPGCPVRGDR